MPVEKADIDKQLASIKEFDKWFTKKEIKYLPQVIREGEVILAMTSGYHDKTTWLIVVTDHRVLFLDKGMIYGLKQLEVPLDKVSGISFKTALVFGKIEIDTSGTRMIIEQILKRDVPHISHILSELVSNKNLSHTRIETAAASENDNSPMNKLERLGKLKDDGLITQEEFDEQKKKLLELI